VSGLPLHMTIQFRLKPLILARLVRLILHWCQGHTGGIEHDVVYGLLMKCLQDVSSIVFMLHLVVIYYLASKF
jgi:hypothetical protein